jgi:TPR repeat protein
MARATKRPQRRRPSKKELREVWAICVPLLFRARSRAKFDQWAKVMRSIAEFGFVDAWFALCLAYAEKKRLREARVCALQFFEHAHEEGVLELALLCIFEDRNGTQEQQRRKGVDPKLGLRLLNERASAGSTEAQFGLSVVYDFGGPVRRDTRKAVHWLRRAAEGSYDTAMVNLGVRHIEGRGVRKSPTEALRWYRRAARSGCETAAHNIGLCYEKGQGVRRDPKKALRWFREAASKGHLTAQARLAEMAIEGVRVKKDAQYGRRRLARLAQRKVPLAMEILSERLIEGHGIAQDVRRGRRLRAQMERELDRSDKEWSGP